MTKPMARTLWCRYEDCQKGYASVAGDRPKICPACERPEAWSTRYPVSTPIRTRYVLAASDRRFLRSLRIAVDEADFLKY